MSLFEFLMVLVSLIIGLGVAELLSGVTQSIRHRDTIQTDWMHSGFVIIVFLALLQQWWEIWGVRDTPTWTFPELLLMLGGPIGLFLIAHLLFPEPIAKANFKSYYQEKMVPILWLGVLTVLQSVLFRPIVLGHSLFAMDNLTSFLIITIFIGMAFIRNRWFHGTMVILLLVGLVADILLVGLEIH